MHTFTNEKLCLVLRTGGYINYIIAFEGFTEQFDERAYILIIDILSDVSNDSGNRLSRSSWM